MVDNKNEDKPFVFISDTEPKEKEKIVEDSGIKMWLSPKSWREKIVDNKKISAVTIVTALLIIALTTISVIQSVTINNKDKKIVVLNAKVVRAEREAEEARSAQADAESQVSVCQESLKVAWKAWNRRNDVMVRMLSNLFSGDTSGVKDDNDTAAIEFRVARDTCDPYMDANEIFTDY